MIPLRLQAARRNVIPRPPDWDKAFRRGGAIFVDLGCGRGDLALELAQRCPERRVVALDNRKKWIERLRLRAQRQGVANLRAIRCDATQDLPVLFPPGSVSAILIHHPDPWWKKRHRKRRLVQVEWIAELARLLQPGGVVYLQTDVFDMAEEMAERFAAATGFTPLDAEAFKHKTLLGIRSHREKRCLALNLPIRRLAYRRVAGEPP
ncbi:MAG: tRNA (guanosine(46)-N7)-methyltransferase TrmB [Myxococcales bacterium]|nr:tRNA (guanosine(46)-N7)-methyltransferase TrmB [Myxococcales bacterium]